MLLLQQNRSYFLNSCKKIENILEKLKKYEKDVSLNLKRRENK